MNARPADHQHDRQCMGEPILKVLLVATINKSVSNDLLEVTIAALDLECEKTSRGTASHDNFDVGVDTDITHVLFAEQPTKFAGNEALDECHSLPLYDLSVAHVHFGLVISGSIVSL